MFDEEYFEPADNDPYYYEDDIILVSNYLNDLYKKYVNNISLHSLSAYDNEIEYRLEPFYPFINRNSIVRINQERFDYLTDKGYKLNFVTGKFYKPTN